MKNRGLSILFMLSILVVPIGVRGSEGAGATHWMTSSELMSEPRFAPPGVDAAASRAAAGDTWDDRFGYPGIGFLPVYALAVSGSNVYVGGEFFDFGTDSFAAANIVRWDGRRWHTLGTGVNAAVKAIAVHGNAVYVGGSFTTAGGVSAGGIARWNGSAWSAVGNGIGVAGGSTYPPTVNAIAFLGDDLYIGGDFASVDGVAAAGVARWDGVAWSPLEAGLTHSAAGSGIVYAMAASDTDLYVGGRFDTAGSVAAGAIARWDGSTWAALGSGVTPEQSYDYPLVLGIALSEGDVYVVGWFKYAGGELANSVAHWDGAGWHALGTGVQEVSDTGSRVHGVVHAISVVASTVYAGGDFDSAGGAAALNLAQWRGNTWSEVGGGVGEDGSDYSYDDPVLALVPSGDGGLYAAGKFTTAGDMTVNNVAGWDGANWHAFGQGLAWQNTSLAAYAVAVNDNGQVFVGGDITHAGGRPASNIAMWDGNEWSPLAEGVDGRVWALVADGDDLYVGGDFTKAGSISANHIARWNQSSGTWSALGSGIDGPVYALAFSQGTLYAGGRFDAAGSASTKHLAWWDGSQWHAFGQTGELESTLSQEVRALAVDEDLVAIGGNFWYVTVGEDDYRVNSLTLWNKATDTWYINLFGPTTYGVTNNQGLPGYVYALAIVDADLYVGGRFDKADSVSANGVARWNFPTATWFALGGSLGGGAAYEEVRALDVIGAGLYVGGHFTAAGTAAANHVARWDTVAHTWSTLEDGITLADSSFGSVFGLASLGADLYLAGDFNATGDHPAADVGHWGPPLPASASALVTPEDGGILASSDGLSLTFPPGAVSQDVTVNYQGQTAPTVPLAGKWGAARSFVLQARTGSGALVTYFADPYTMEIAYTEAELAASGVKEEALNLLYRSGSTWVAMLPCTGCGVDVADNRLTVIADHFTEFVLAGEQERLYLPILVR